MTILFRYIGLEFAKLFLMCFSGLMTIYLVIDFFEKLRRFLKFDAQMSDILAFFLLRTPGITFQIAPLAILMATLLSLGLLSRNHEITAMRSCGVSLGRLAAPFLVIGAVISLLLLGMTSVIIPTATARAEYVKNTFIEKETPKSGAEGLTALAPDSRARPAERGIGRTRRPCAPRCARLSVRTTVSSHPLDGSQAGRPYGARLDASGGYRSPVSPQRQRDDGAVYGEAPVALARTAGFRLLVGRRV
jgi:hypothetical protein